MLPPEINSARMYAGAGPGPMLAAAAAWDGLASELRSATASYLSVVEGLTGWSWQGPSSMSMAVAAAPYVTWMSGVAAQAEETANHARAAAAAYETAFAATVPPPVIAANRALLITLIATNILGQNTPAIASTEAHYMEMWAQDATAMYGYAGSSGEATRLTPFTEPPQTTDTAPAALRSASQATSAETSNIGTQLSQLMSSLSDALHSLATGAMSPATAPTNLWSAVSLPQLNSLTLPTALSSDLTNWDAVWSTLTGPYSIPGLTGIPGGPFLTTIGAYGWVQNGQGVTSYLAGPHSITGALAPLASGANTAHPVLSSADFGGAAASGAMGNAAQVGRMSVPQGWTEAAPAIRTLAAAVPAGAAAAPAASLTSEGGVFGQMALSGLAGRAIAVAVTRSGGGGAARSLEGVVAEADPAAATIIVIPALEG